MKLNSEQQALVSGHLRVVEDTIRYHIRANENVQGLGYDDLYQEGCVALCRASQASNRYFILK
jgi:DNA-directed RNA polymerase specialized sigma subunit